MSSTTRRHTLWLGMACTFAAIVAWLSLSRTVVELPNDPGGHLAHVLAYASLMFMLSRIYVTTGSRILVAVALIALGVGLEFAQAWTGYRNYERGDMVADAAGIVLGWFAERTFATLDTLRRSTRRV